jgi:hypothetical protein
VQRDKGRQLSQNIGLFKPDPRPAPEGWILGRVSCQKSVLCRIGGLHVGTNTKGINTAPLHCVLLWNAVSPPFVLSHACTAARSESKIKKISNVIVHHWFHTCKSFFLQIEWASGIKIRAVERRLLLSAREHSCKVKLSDQ